MRERVALVTVVALVVTAGCAEIYETDDETDVALPTSEAAPPDPATDRIGWENGVWYNESLPVTAEDGLNETELQLVVARAMARVEQIRQLEFKDDVDVRVTSREQFRENNPFEVPSDPFRDQAYEALFLVDERTDSATVLGEIYGGSLAGTYDYASERIVLITDNGSESVEIDPAILAHELVHALQDDHFRPAGGPGGTDGRNALLSLSEGSAKYVEDRYAERCEAEWDCLPAPTVGDSGEVNAGVFLTIFVPYSDGPTLIRDLIDRADGDWRLVNQAWDRPPVSTEQVIHPEKYPDERPVDVRIEDRSAEEWKPIGDDGGTADRLGEAGIFAMLWANGVVPEESLLDDQRRYNYSHPASAGWGGDLIRAYERDGEYAYVWKTVWDTDRDADQFVAAYRDLLDSKDAVAVGDDRYRIDEGGFADAFWLLRDDRTVTIVNAPTVDALDDVYGTGDVGDRAAVEPTNTPGAAPAVRP